jgi:hypothetical protein
MDSPNTRAILGWFMRVKFIALPTSGDEKNFYTMQFKNVDDNKITTKTFPMQLGDRAMYAKWAAALKATNQRSAGILVGGGGRLRQFAYTNLRTGVERSYHASDILLGEWAQSRGMYKNYIFSNKATGITSYNEGNNEWKQVMKYKSAYRARMFAKAREVMATRAKLWKTSPYIYLENYHTFSIPMWWQSFDRNDYGFVRERSYYNQ